MVKEEKWKLCGAVLTLLVHGIVLFPNIDNFVDHLEVEIFLAGNPVPFLLEDFYHTFQTRNEKKSENFLCYALLLHLWMKTRMPQKDPFISKGLTKESGKLKNVILKHRGFPSVPLIGTHGCINYNPVLLKRKLGHAMVSPPGDKDLVPCIINDVDPFNPAVRRVRRAWTKIIRIGQEWGKKNVISKEPYIQWVREQAQIVKNWFAKMINMHAYGLFEVLVQCFL